MEYSSRKNHWRLSIVLCLANAEARIDLTGARGTGLVLPFLARILDKVAGSRQTRLQEGALA
jgi:hypothetical protein